MIKLFITPILALMMFSINTNAQCCPVSKSEQIAALSNNLQTVKTVKFKITGITCAGCSNTILTKILVVRYH